MAAARYSLPLQQPSRNTTYRPPSSGGAGGGGNGDEGGIGGLQVGSVKGLQFGYGGSFCVLARGTGLIVNMAASVTVVQAIAKIFFTEQLLSCKH